MVEVLFHTFSQIVSNKIIIENLLHKKDDNIVLSCEYKLVTNLEYPFDYDYHLRIVINLSYEIESKGIFIHYFML